MRQSLKIALSFLISLLLFGVFLLFAYSGLFGAIEADFLQPRVRQGLERDVRSLADAVKRYHGDRIKLFTGLLSDPAMSNAFLSVDPTPQDARTREDSFSRLKETNRNVQYVRFLDADGRKIHFSTLLTDRDVRQDKPDQRVYYRYEQVDPSIPAADLRATESSGPRVLVDGVNRRFVYSLPMFDGLKNYRGAAIFYVLADDLVTYLLDLRDQSIRDIVIVDRSGIVANLRVSEKDRSAVQASVSAAWQGQAIDVVQEKPFQFQADGGERWMLASLQTGAYGAVGLLVPYSSFVLDAQLKALLLVVVFVTLFLACFLVLNIRQDPVVVVARRVKRFQVEFVQEFLDSGDELRSDRWSTELARRKTALSTQIRKGTGRVSDTKQQAIDDLINRSWEEILAILNARTPHPRAEEETVDLKRIEQIIQRALSGSHVVLQAAAVTEQPVAVRQTARRGVAAAAAPVEARAVSVGAAEPAAGGAGAEDLEELGEAESVEEIEEIAAEPREGGQGAVAGEVAEAEGEGAVEELGEAEELEEIGQLEEVEATGETPAEATAQGVEAPGGEPEAIADLEEVGDAEEVDEAESAEPDEESQEVPSPVAAHAIQGWVEEPGAEAEVVAELEEVGEAEEVEEAAEEVEEAAEEVEEAAEEIEEAAEETEALPAEATAPESAGDVEAPGEEQGVAVEAAELLPELEEVPPLLEPLPPEPEEDLELLASPEEEPFGTMETEIGAEEQLEEAELEEIGDLEDASEADLVAEDAEEAPEEPVPAGEQQTLEQLREHIRAGTILIWEPAALAAALQERQSSVVLENGVYRIREDVYRAARAPQSAAEVVAHKNGELRDLAESVMVGPESADGMDADLVGMSGIGDILGGIDGIDLLDQAEIEEIRAEPRAADRVERKAKRLSMVGGAVDLDGYLRQFADPEFEPTQFRALVEVSRRVQAVAAAVLVESGGAYRSLYSIGLADSGSGRFSFPVTGAVGVEILAGRRAAVVNEGLDGLSAFSQKASADDLRFMRRACMLPAVFRSQAAYLFLAFAEERTWDLPMVLEGLDVG